MITVRSKPTQENYNQNYCSQVVKIADNKAKMHRTYSRNKKRNGSRHRHTDSGTVYV